MMYGFVNQRCESVIWIAVGHDNDQDIEDRDQHKIRKTSHR
jgi:hypothetical protein